MLAVGQEKMKEKLSWWVPFRVQVSEAKRELPKVFPPLVIIRLVLALFILIVIGANVLPKVIPHLEFDWVHAFFMCLAFLVVILAMSCVVVLIPPYVIVTPKGIAVSQGQSTAHFPFAELAELRIDEQDSPPSLVLRRRDQPSHRKFAISAKVDLTALHEALDPHKPKR